MNGRLRIRQFRPQVLGNALRGGGRTLSKVKSCAMMPRQPLVPNLIIT